MVGMKKTAELFSQGGQSGISKEGERGFGAVTKWTRPWRKAGLRKNDSCKPN